MKKQRQLAISLNLILLTNMNVLNIIFRNSNMTKVQIIDYQDESSLTQYFFRTFQKMLSQQIFLIYLLEIKNN
ncbi:hypothetical protein pb186bvf_012763 [Paramecium bursaria]